MKKIYIESLGCAKNQVDSEILLSYALEKGYERVENVEDADLIVVNTCGFIESAKEESINTFFTLNNKNKKAKIIMAGCLAERYGSQMELEEATAIFGNHDLSKFPLLLDLIEKGEENIVLRPKVSIDERDDRLELLSYPRSAYLKISEGCNHNCSYCAIPLIRGPLKSRPIESVVKEAERLIQKGIYEINLIAQDLGYYGLDLYGESKFCTLMEKLSSLEGDFVLRMLYIHPDTFPIELIEIVKNNKKILPYFDIPFQHASPKILRAMGRIGDEEKYLSLILKIREVLPAAVIRSTLMLGFPGENKETFSTLLDFVKRAELDWMGSFVYSREEGTKAFNIVSEKEHKRDQKNAEKWKKELEEVQSNITQKRLNNFVGNEYTCLIEENIEGEDLALGRIYSQAPDVDGLTVVMGRDLKGGDVIKVGIKSVRGVDLEGVKIGWFVFSK